METLKFKVGDKVRVKSLEWYNEKKNKKGVVRIDTDNCVNFTAEMSRLCGEIMQVEEMRDYFYIMNGSIFSWQDWMIEDEVVEDIKSRILTKEVAQAVVRCTKYIIKNENENANVQKKLFEIGCKWASGGKEVANESCKYLYVDKNLNITMGEVGEEDFYMNEPSAELSVNDILNIEIKDTKEMTKEEVFAYLNNTKIRCESKEESEKVQKKLFKLGYAFRASGKVIQSTYLLYIEDNYKLLLESNYNSWIENESTRIEPSEILAIQLKEEKPKFDTKMLQTFDKVLVRQSGTNMWRANVFEYYENNKYYAINGTIWNYCIPFNDETKHLHRTCDDAPDYYKNW